MKTRFLCLLLIAAAPLTAQEIPDPAPRWADFDDDGLLDAFVVGPDGGHLYRQVAPGRFDDVTLTAGLGGGTRTWEASWRDLDDDGDADLVVLGAGGARMLENNAGAFRDVTIEAGLVTSDEPLRLSWRDFDGDGRPDLEILEHGHALLFRNLEGIAFERAELELPVHAPAAAPGATPATTLGPVAGGSSPQPADRGAQRIPASPGARTTASVRGASGSGRRPAGSGGGAPTSSGNWTIGQGGPGAPTSGGLTWADRLIDQADGKSLLGASSKVLFGHLLPLGETLWLGNAEGKSMTFDFDGAHLRLFGSEDANPLYGPHLVVDRENGLVGVGTDAPHARLHISGMESSAELRVEADVNNTDENAQPRLTLVQDGGQVTGMLGYFDGSNDLSLRNGQGGTSVVVRSAGDLAVLNDAGQRTASLNPSSGLGGALHLWNEQGSLGVRLEAAEGSSGGNLELHAAGGALTAALDGDEGGDAKLRLFDAVGNNTVLLEASESSSGGNLELRAADGALTAALDADEGGDAKLRLLNAAGTNTVLLEATEGTSGGNLELRTAAGQVTVRLDAEESEDSALRLYQLDGTNTVAIAASENGTGANIVLRADSGQPTIIIDADEGGSADGAIRFFNEAGTETAVLHGYDEGFAGAILRLRDATGTTRINLNAATGVTTTPQLQITGGADIAEPFVCGGDGAQPGYLVSIDPKAPGQLLVSTHAYDPKVAGVVSGAGGIQAGLTLKQTGTVADGDVPVALTGRVWCWADSSRGAIRPGDLLTTSSLAGHAMRATDETRSFGAVVGKAMSSLEEGTGLVLVLVNLQ